MSTELLTKDEASTPRRSEPGHDELRAADRSRLKKVARLKLVIAGRALKTSLTRHP